jgi:hypothetical protein
MRPTATWVVEGHKSHPNQPIHVILIDPFHTQELGIHSYILEQHFYIDQSLTKCHKREIKQERATRVRLVLVPCENH